MTALKHGEDKILGLLSRSEAKIQDGIVPETVALDV